MRHDTNWPLVSPTLPFEQPSHLLAGIDRVAQSDEAARLARQRLEFVSPQGPSPTQHQQYPKRHEPWNTESLRSEDPMVLDQRSPSFPVPENSLSPTSSNDKGSRRNGPLTAEARRNANIVRQMRACRRCVYMKEPVRDLSLASRGTDRLQSATDRTLARIARERRVGSGKPAA